MSKAKANDTLEAGNIILLLRNRWQSMVLSTFEHLDFISVGRQAYHISIPQKYPFIPTFPQQKKEDKFNNLTGRLYCLTK